MDRLEFQYDLDFIESLYTFPWEMLFKFSRETRMSSILAGESSMPTRSICQALALALALAWIIVFEIDAVFQTVDHKYKTTITVNTWIGIFSNWDVYVITSFKLVWP